MILVIFGSKSDSGVYNEIARLLGRADFELRIASAHKTPRLVAEILKKNYKVIIAGAGLAAHLPGVIASQKTCPVIGVPCSGAYDGLDAFLSIAQMPPGIPVLAVGVNNAVEAANAAVMIEKGIRKINLVGDNEPCEKTLKELGVNYSKGGFAKDAVNLSFVKIGDRIISRKELVIYCPVAEKTGADDGIVAMKMAKAGLWVGVNRAENAAVAAAEIIGLNINAYRAALAKKVIDADKEAK
ncbi:MAG: AIR carboxylase family protein [Candidatus Woesearchaeota archaeon]